MENETRLSCKMFHFFNISFSVGLFCFSNFVIQFLDPNESAGSDILFDNF